MYLHPKNDSVRIVSFSGIDGAGKTTQIRNLCALLAHAGVTYRVVAFWDDIARLTRFRESAGHALFKGDKGVGSPSAPINRRDKNVRSWVMTGVRLCLYSLDALSTRAAVMGVRRSHAGVVIFDRFIYDELANLNLQNPFLRAFVRLVAIFVPRPHVSYVLDADPMQARARKPEYPVDFLYTSRDSYLTLSDLIGGMTVISPMPEEDVKREILSYALSELSLESDPGNAAHSASSDALADKPARLEEARARPAPT